jgi:NTE family protein
MSGLGLVLSGGGAPAAYFGAGVIRAIEQSGLEPTLLSGVSAGALNACGLAHGLDSDDLADMWTAIRWKDIYGVRLDVWNAFNFGRLARPSTNLIEYALGSVAWTWLLDNSPARRTLMNYMGGEELTVQAGKTAIVSAVEEATANVVRFCSEPPPAMRADPSFHHVGITVDHMLASAAVPLLFPPGRVGERTYVDAGLMANTPLAPIMAYEPDAVIIVSGAGLPRPAQAASSWGEAIELLVNNVAHYSLMADYHHAQTINTLATAAPETTVKRPVPMLLIEPAELGFKLGGFLRFSTDEAERTIKYGQTEAERMLSQWEWALA